MNKKVNTIQKSQAAVEPGGNGVTQAQIDLLLDPDEHVKLQPLRIADIGLDLPDENTRGWLRKQRRFAAMTASGSWGTETFDKIVDYLMEYVVIDDSIGHTEEAIRDCLFDMSKKEALVLIAAANSTGDEDNVPLGS